LLNAIKILASLTISLLSLFNSNCAFLCYLNLFKTPNAPITTFYLILLAITSLLVVAFQKKNIPNNICNALFTICKSLGAIAGTTISPQDTLLEPTNLLPDTPLRCLGDILLCLHPAPTNPCQRLAIDVTITGNPPFQQHPFEVGLPTVTNQLPSLGPPS
jgi:hypothetical protein